MKKILLTTILSALAISLPTYCAFITVPSMTTGEITINVDKISHVSAGGEMGTAIWVDGNALRTSLTQDKVVYLISHVVSLYHYSQLNKWGNVVR
jgi:hypothetical protein